MSKAYQQVDTSQLSFLSPDLVMYGEILYYKSCSCLVSIQHVVSACAVKHDQYVHPILKISCSCDDTNGDDPMNGHIYFSEVDKVASKLLG